MANVGRVPTIVDVLLPLSVERKFYVNSLVPTHGQLLLRSPKGNSYEDRIDVVFKAVTAMKLGFELASLAIRVPTGDETKSVESDCGKEVLSLPDYRIYMIEGGFSPGYVVALSAFVARDDRPDPNQSSLVFDMRGGEPPEGEFYRLI